jgi:hypothetical protein
MFDILITYLVVEPHENSQAFVAQFLNSNPLLQKVIFGSATFLAGRSKVFHLYLDPCDALEVLHVAVGEGIGEAVVGVVHGGEGVDVKPALRMNVIIGMPRTFYLLPTS